MFSYNKYIYMNQINNNQNLNKGKNQYAESDFYST
jgi:hypothetical protein